MKNVGLLSYAWEEAMTLVNASDSLFGRIMFLFLFKPLLLNSITHDSPYSAAICIAKILPAKILNLFPYP